MYIDSINYKAKELEDICKYLCKNERNYIIVNRSMSNN